MKAIKVTVVLMLAFFSILVVLAILEVVQADVAKEYALKGGTILFILGGASSAMFAVMAGRNEPKSSGDGEPGPKF